MKKIKLALSFLISPFLFIFLGLNSLAQLPYEIDQGITQFQLDNGLTVILNEDHSSREIFGIVVCKAGGKNDPSDATGMAHYQEHMLFKGTDELGTKNWELEKPLIDQIIGLYEELSKTTDEEKRLEIQMEINKISVEAAQYAIPNEFSTIIKSMGGTNLNANTNDDRTVYFNKFPSNQIDKWLELYSHRFINPVFRLFQSELEVVYEEKNMGNDRFVVPLIEKFNQNFFKNHPYGQQTVIGTIDHLKNPSLRKMIDFFETYYVANNMALILVGDFNTEKVKPVIEEKFGNWRSGEVPEFPKYEENDFIGRELIEDRLSPVKLGLLGFRTPPVTDPDDVVIAVINKMLSNENQTGLIDQLSLENKILAAQIFSWPRNDMGQAIILFVPKIVGQKLDDAEALVLAELQKLKNGEFEDWLLEAQKKSIYKSWMLESEDIAYKGQKMAEFFQMGKTMNEMIAYPDMINQVTKEDVIRVANKYYGANYLAFHSKMGFKKPEKIKQPEFESVETKTNDKSSYRKYLESIPSNELIPKYLNFDKDLNETMITKGVNLYYNLNPQNDIFTFKIRYGIGDYELPMLKYASYLMNYAGTSDMSMKDFKNEFSKLGCSYSIFSDDSYLTIEMDGVDENFDSAFDLIFKLIDDPVIDESKISMIYEEEKAERKMERSEPDNVADALFEYVQFKDKSSYLDRLSLKEIKALETAPLIQAFKQATVYETDYFYVGTYDKNKVASMLKGKIRFLIEPKASQSPIHKEREKYAANKVYLVNKKKANQSKIYFLINGKPFTIEDEANINAFNIYFGGGFSGLVLQEIREYRSMAYSAGASYKISGIAGKENLFYGYIGTQADKTIEAVDVFNGLIREMPEKTERIDFIKEYLQLTTLSASPGFRNLSEYILKLKVKGYHNDPAEINIPKYRSLKFEDIVNFYKQNIKNQPMVIAVVGNLKQFDYKKLEQYGEVVVIKEKALFSK